MAIAIGTGRLSDNHKTSASTWTTSAWATANATAGHAIVIACVTDNIATTDGNSNTHTGLTDSTGGNTYTKQYEWTEAPTANSATGTTTSVWLCAQVASTVTAASTTFEFTFSDATTAKAAAGANFTLAASKKLQINGTGYGTGAAGGSPTISPSGHGATGHLFIAADGIEGLPSDSFTQDTDYTGINAPGTTGGAQPSNVTLRFARRIATEDGNTWAPTHTTDRDYSAVVVVFDEVDAAQNANVTTTTVNATTAVATPTVTAGASNTPGSVSATTTVPTPSVTAGASPTMTTVSVTTTVPTPSVSVTQNPVVTPTTVSGTTSVPTPTVTAGAAPTLTTVQAVVSIPTPTVTTEAGGTDANITLTTVTATVSIPTPGVTAGALVTPTTVSTAATVPTPSATAGATVTTDLVSAAATVPGASVVAGATVTLSTVTASVAISTPTVSTAAPAAPRPSLVAARARERLVRLGLKLRD